MRWSSSNCPSPPISTSLIVGFQLRKNLPGADPQQVTPIRITISSIVHSSSLEHCSRSRTVDRSDIFQRYSNPGGEFAQTWFSPRRVELYRLRYSPRAASFLVVLHTIYLACAARASDRQVAIQVAISSKQVAIVSKSRQVQRTHRLVRPQNTGAADPSSLTYPCTGCSFSMTPCLPGQLQQTSFARNDGLVGEVHSQKGADRVLTFSLRRARTPLVHSSPDSSIASIV